MVRTHNSLYRWCEVCVTHLPAELCSISVFVAFVAYISKHVLSYFSRRKLILIFLKMLILNSRNPTVVSQHFYPPLGTHHVQQVLDSFSSQMLKKKMTCTLYVASGRLILQLLISLEVLICSPYVLYEEELVVIKLTFDGQFHCEIIYLKCSSQFMRDSISVSSYFRNCIELILW